MAYKRCLQISRCLKGYVTNFVFTQAPEAKEFGSEETEKPEEEEENAKPEGEDEDGEEAVAE